MRMVATNRCPSGVRLAKPIYSERGTKLVGEDVELTSGMIERLKQSGISYLYVKDKVADDINVEEPIPMEVRIEAVQTIQSIFTTIQAGYQKGERLVSPRVKVDQFRNVFSNLLKAIKESQRTLSLLTEIHNKDSYVFSHSLNVAIYTIALGVKKGYNDQQLADLGMGALLHDIGKMLIPPAILHKPGKLTEEEFMVVQKHPEYGFDLLKKEFEISYLSAHCAFQHHERWDGLGYPRGLKGEEIHPYARLMAVCDVFDAMTSHRVYRNALLPSDSMAWIRSKASVAFEEEAVDIFHRTISLFPIGMTVQLNTGETAVVIDTNADAPDRPIVRVFKDPNGETLSVFHELDLNKHVDVTIVGCDTLL